MDVSIHALPFPLVSRRQHKVWILSAGYWRDPSTLSWEKGIKWRLPVTTPSDHSKWPLQDEAKWRQQDATLAPIYARVAAREVSVLFDLDAESVRIRVDGGGDAMMQWFMFLIH